MPGRTHLATITLLAGLGLAHAGEEAMASGISLSYIPLLAGSLDLGPRSLDWDSGHRIELQMRDYWFPGQSHHPFYELGLILEQHEAEDDATVTAETWGIKAAVGTAVPVWVGDGSAIGYAPMFAAHLGRLTLDVSHPGGADSSDDAIRAGMSLGLDGWAVVDRTVTFGLGPFVSYWRAQDLAVADGAGGTERVSPSGWDAGVRLLVGVIF